jgi:hypothetical protein
LPSRTVQTKPSWLTSSVPSATLGDEADDRDDAVAALEDLLHLEAVVLEGAPHAAGGLTDSVVAVTCAGIHGVGTVHELEVRRHQLELRAVSAVPGVEDP